jgi:DNA-directed RNA polymerase subunit beta
LVNHETGEINKCRKGKTGVSDGLFFANIPVMTTKGTFVINGIEKFVISQIVRSPGVYVRNKTDIKLNNKKKVNNGMILEILPSRGTLMNFIVDPKTATVKCMMRNSIGDNAPTFPATLLLKSFGMSQDEILNIFRNDEYIINTIVSETHHSGEHIYGYNHQNILEHPDILALMKTIDDQERLHRDTFKGLPIELKLRDALKDYMAQKRSYDELKNKYDQLYSEYEASGNEKKHIDQIESLIERMNKQEQKMRQSLDVIIIEKSSKDVVMLLGVSIKNIEAHAKSKADICYQNVLCNHFMNERVYDLTSAGRYKTERKLRISERLFNRVLASDVLLKNGKTLLKKNTFVNRDVLNQFKEATIKGELANIEFSLKNENALLKKQLHTLQVVDVYTSNDTLEFSTPIIGPADDANTKALTIGDFISSISYAINLPNDIGTYDDIDHLGNKRLRLIHEQLRNKLVAGMARVEKHIKEKLSSISIPTANEEQKAKIAARTTVKSVVNTKPFQLVIKNFFNSYQLTQFIDQQNPLSELTNKRRISAMGDGGISREDPNLDIRDIHYSHYGKICPIETPEGMNIGLILSLASFAKVDEHGFLITPYKKVVDGVVQDKNIE